MPIYEYLCAPCDKIFEIIQKLDVKKAACPVCKHTTKQKLISSGSFELIGQGFYKPRSTPDETD